MNELIEWLNKIRQDLPEKEQVAFMDALSLKKVGKIRHYLKQNETSLSNDFKGTGEEAVDTLQNAIIQDLLQMVNQKINEAEIK